MSAIQSVTLRYCFGDKEWCRDAKPESEFWRGGRLCRECRKDIQRKKANARGRKWWAAKKVSDPRWVEEQNQRRLADWHRRFMSPEVRQARRKQSRDRYRHDDSYRAKRTADERTRYWRRRGKEAWVCGAPRTRKKHGLCTEITSHPSRLCVWHRPAELASVTRPESYIGVGGNA